MMPNLSFDFFGSVSDAEISKAYVPATGQITDISSLTRAELVDKLNSGELAISFNEAVLADDIVV